MACQYPQISEQFVIYLVNLFRLSLFSQEFSEIQIDAADGEYRRNIGAPIPFIMLILLIIYSGMK